MKHQAFYETAAQVIPLLFLVLVFETRSWSVLPTSSRRLRIYRRTLVGALVTFAVLGEYVALTALRDLKDADWRVGIVSGALTSLLGGTLVAGLEAALAGGRGFGNDQEGEKRTAPDKR